MKLALNWAADLHNSVPRSTVIYWQFEAQFWNDEVLRTIGEVEKENRMSFRFRKVDTPKANKMLRIMTLLPYFQNSRIYHNIRKKAHNDTLIGNAQLKAIEPGYKGHDDAPDADEQAIKFLEQFITSNEAPPPKTGMTERKYDF